MIIFILGSFPNSHRNIEPELMRIMIQNRQLDDYTATIEIPNSIREALRLLNPWPSVGSLEISETHEHDAQQLQDFLLMSSEVFNRRITGTERFPGGFLSPENRNTRLPSNLLQHLAGFYQTKYDYQFGIPSENLIEDDIIVLPFAHQYGRLQIGPEVFGSAMTSRHISSSYILVNFVNQREDTCDTYPGQVQFYIEHTLDFPDGTQKTHSLAFVLWYTPASNKELRYELSPKVNGRKNFDLCNVELWDIKWSATGSDGFIPVQQILTRFIPSNFLRGRQQLNRMLAVIPINKRFHV